MSKLVVSADECGGVSLRLSTNGLAWMETTSDGEAKGEPVTYDK